MLNPSLKGTLYGAIAAISYGMNPLFALPLYQEGLSPDSVLFYRFSLGGLLLGFLLKLQKQSLRLKRHEVLPMLILGLFFSASSLLLYQSFLYMEAGIACTILFLYPLMVALIMTFFFKEKASVLTYGCIALATGGIALLYRGEGGETLSTAGVILVILSALSYSIYMVGVNRSCLRNMEAGKLTFWALLFGSMIYVLRLGFLKELQVPATPGAYLCIGGMVAFPTILSLFCIGVAIHCIGSTFTAILGALEPVTALLFGVFFFHEQITPRIMTGVVLILLAVLILVTGKPLLQRLRPPEPKSDSAK